MQKKQHSSENISFQGRRDGRVITALSPLFGDWTDEEAIKDTSQEEVSIERI
jgi:hypothetical protein